MCTPAPLIDLLARRQSVPTVFLKKWKTRLFEVLKITVNLSLGDVKLFGQLRNGRASGKPTGHEIDARGLAIGFRFSALAAGHAQRLN